MLSNCSMGHISSDLRNMGYERTERQSPFDEDGELWSKGYELVCDETGYVIRNDSSENSLPSSDDSKVYRYQNSRKAKLIGGFLSSYEWGYDEDRFLY